MAGATTGPSCASGSPAQSETTIWSCRQGRPVAAAIAWAGRGARRTRSAAATSAALSGATAMPRSRASSAEAVWPRRAGAEAFDERRDAVAREMPDAQPGKPQGHAATLPLRRRYSAATAKREGTRSSASPSTTTLSATLQRVPKETRRLTGSMAVTVTVASTVSPIFTGARKRRVCER